MTLAGSWKFSAVHLHSMTGELIDGVRRADEKYHDYGNLTYGPYLALSAGRYEFEIEYRADCDVAPGSWDVITTASGGVTLGRGNLDMTSGRIAKLRGAFSVTIELAQQQFEIRTFFNGRGVLDIISIFISSQSTSSEASVCFGDLRRLEPMSEEFGHERGTPLDRYYISEFLAQNRERIRGRVLEVGERHYTVRYGGRRVSHSDVVSPVPGPQATVIADLTAAIDIPDASYDCIILTQVLNVVYDVHAVLRTLHRILKPGGTVLATVPSIQKAHQEYEWPFTWGFTAASAERLFSDTFGAEQVLIETYGNVLSATAFLYGLAFHELRECDLRYRDKNFQVLIGIRADKRRH